MITRSIRFECLTPCFCAGADPSRAEIRAPAIRGALRWWFRALGGSRELEHEVFGGVADPVRGSAIRLRVSNTVEKPTGPLPTVGTGRDALNPTDPLAYILYFASVGGGSGAQFGQGPRWQEQGNLGPGTTFDVHLQRMRSLPEAAQALLDLSVDAFEHFGAIGLRATRGLGAVQAHEVTTESFTRCLNELESRGFIVRIGEKAHTDWKKLMKSAGVLLKHNLRSEYGAGGNKKPARASALGSIKPIRQTSAVYLRPIKVDGNLRLCAFEAPHDRVLVSESKRPHEEPVLKSRRIE